MFFLDLRLEPIVNSIVCGKLETDKSFIHLRDFAEEGEGEAFELQATLVIDAVELPLFTWNGTLSKGSKPIPLTQPAANLANDSVQALNDLLPSDDRSYDLRFDFTTTNELTHVEFQVVHRLLLATTLASCNGSSE